MKERKKERKKERIIIIIECNKINNLEIKCDKKTERISRLNSLK